MNKVIHSPNSRLARVALDVPLDTHFDYLTNDLTPEDLGRRVTVPFGAQSLIGVITELPTETEVPEDRLKSVLHVHRDTPALPPSFLKFLSFAARYYHYPLGQVILAAIPPRLRETTPWSERRRQRQKHLHAAEMLHPPHTLSAQQKNVVDAVLPSIEGAQFAAFLLHGVTGSGKTEVYFEWVSAVLEKQKKALILVPEINLTPQLTARVRARFTQVPLIELHSRLSAHARTEAWLKLFEPGPGIVIGTRLAILSPIEDLGLIIVDEEHDPSFKQHEGLRYSARDLAVMRAREAACPLILGSATPSLESLYQVKKDKYTYLHLPERADPRAVLPTIHQVDVRRSTREAGLTAEARQLIQDTLNRGEQSLVFINRRGYSPVLWCNACGWFAACSRCQSKLVFYRKSRKAVCHLCGYTAPTPKACPECGNPELVPAGEGSERLEEALNGFFPEARVVRVDTDSMSTQKGFSNLRSALLQNEVDILVGTQMLAKGHDFPNLTTVIVVNPDNALFSTDFRAEERLLQQLTQVAGRAGRRDRPGQVLIQTAQPDHPLFQALVRHDFSAYAAHLLKVREVYGFPPFTYQALLRASHRDESALKAFFQFAKSSMDVFDWPELVIYDPVPASEPRIANKYRYQLLLQASSRAALHPALGELTRILERYSGPRISWVLDVDPQDI